jgi:hypothetical protein
MERHFVFVASATTNDRWLKSVILFCVLCLGSLIFTACEHTTKEVSLGNVGAPPLLEAKGRFYVAYALNIRGKEGPVLDSGRMVTEPLRAAFQKEVRAVFGGRLAETLDEGKANAAKANAHYLVYPTIMRWEDRSTEFSGRRDKVEIRLELWNVPEDRLMDIRLIQGTSKWMTDGGDKPQDLLAEPFAKYAASFFTAPPSTPTAMPRPRN